MPAEPPHPGESSGEPLARWRERLGRTRHDLLNPLSDILGFVDLVIDDAREQGLGPVAAELESLRQLANRLYRELKHPEVAGATWSQVDRLENLKQNVVEQAEAILGTVRNLLGRHEALREGTLGEDLRRVREAADRLRCLAPPSVDDLMTLAAELRGRP